jgi:hypothetical protein
MLTHKEQMDHGERLVAAARKWAEAKGFEYEKIQYARIFAAAIGAVQDAGPSMLSFDEMQELLGVLDTLSKGE